MIHVSGDSACDDHALMRDLHEARRIALRRQLQALVVVRHLILVFFAFGQAGCDLALGGREDQHALALAAGV